MRRTVIICCLLMFAANIVFSQKFWSPREIVLDTYEKPIPFQRGGETCIAYELHITNMDSYAISLKRIEILLDGSDASYKMCIVASGERGFCRVRENIGSNPCPPASSTFFSLVSKPRLNFSCFRATLI